jgi:tetratricopeptide (TPR) repeat protein
LVRRLIAANARFTYNSPIDSFIITRLASEIAEGAIADKAISVFETHFEHAYACLYVGSHSAALSAIDRARECLASAAICGFEEARLSLLRSMVLQEMERFDEAAELASEAGRYFRRYGDLNRYAVAKLTEAGVLFRSNRYNAAVSTYIELDALADSLDAQTLAFTYLNGAICSRETGDFGRAEDKFVKAVHLFNMLGLSAPLVKSNWMLARVFVATGQYARALTLFQKLRMSFEELGMSYDLAGLLVDMCETLLALGRSLEIAPLCREAISYFERSGLTHTVGARTALAYLQDASAGGYVSTGAIQLVRAYFEQLPRAPQLLFSPPHE